MQTRTATLAATLLAITTQVAQAQLAVARQPQAPAPSLQLGLPDPILGLPGYVSQRGARAIVYLEALRQGRLFTSDLSPQQLQDVLDFEREPRSGGAADDGSFAP